MSTYNIDWNYGENKVIDFDPKNDKLNLNWLSAASFTLEEKDGAVIITIPGGNQVYTLENCTLADLTAANVIANDSSAQALFGGSDPVDPVDPVNPVNPDNPDNPVTPDDPTHQKTIEPKDHVVTIDYSNWNSEVHVQNFNAKTDKIDFAWMQSNEFTVSEKDGCVVISVPGSQECFIIDNVSLADLSMDNIDAQSSSTFSAWQEALGVDPDAPPVIPDIDPNAPAMPTAYEFAPYVDMTAWPTPDLVSIVSKSGVKDFTLAFMVSDEKTGGLSWGGVISMDQDKQPDNRYTFKQEIEAVQNAGGDVTLSFGGANGVEAAITAAQKGSSAQDLADLYQSAIDKYHLDSIDFDIEGGAQHDKASVDLRNEAIAILEKNNANLEVSYTLPVLPDGLTLDGMNLLRSAEEHGVKLNVVNLMAMDYGSSVDEPAGNHLDMAQAAIDAANSTHAQMESLGITDTKIGLTPMIGMNDDTNEIFTLDDASRLAQYASEHSDTIGRLSMWSLGRDTAGGNVNYVSPSFSSVEQNDYDFSHRLMGA